MKVRLLKISIHKLYPKFQRLLPVTDEVVAIPVLEFCFDAVNIGGDATSASDAPNTEDTDGNRDVF